MSRSQRLCRLCEFPVADGAVPVDALDADKWAAWCRCTLGAEFKIETDAEKARTLICQFCICEARLVHDNLQDDCSCGNKRGFDWWTGHGDNHFYQQFFYQQSLIQPCKVVLEKISSDPGQDLIGTTAVVLNGSRICSQHKLERKPRARPKRVEICFDEKSVKEIFPCTLCKNHYSSHKNVSKHTNLMHKNAVRCKSNQCNTYFLTETEKRQHEEKTHLSEGSGKRLKCMFCGVLLSSVSGSMNKHVKNMHKEAVKCDFDYRIRCPEYFHTRAEKNKHILEVHNKVNLDPKICIYCGKTYNNNNYLMKHIRQIHADINIKCTFRGCSEYFFNHKDSEEHCLKKHQHAQSLKKFKCPKCSFRTSRKNCWRNHMLRFHTKEASFKCTQCPRSFFVKKLLNQHLNTFHGEQCTCEHCGKTMQKQSMQLHFLSKHALPTSTLNAT